MLRKILDGTPVAPKLSESELLIKDKTKELRDLFISGQYREVEVRFAKELLPLLINTSKLNEHLKYEDIISTKPRHFSMTHLAKTMLKIIDKLNKDEPKIIVVAGISGSGKSTLLSQIQKQRPEVIVIHQDEFLDRPTEKNPKYVLNFPEMQTKIKTIISTAPKNSTIIIEGSRLLAYPEIHATADLSFFIHVPFEQTLFDLFLRNILLRGLKPEFQETYVLGKLENGQEKTPKADFYIEQEGTLVSKNPKALSISKATEIKIQASGARKETVLMDLLSEYQQLINQQKYTIAIKKIRKAIVQCAEANYFTLEYKLTVIEAQLEHLIHQKQGK